jgi:hypothetical protein
MEVFYGQSHASRQEIAAQGRPIRPPLNPAQIPAFLRNRKLGVVFDCQQLIFRHMKTGTLSRLLTAAVLAGFAAGALAEKETPYQIIVDRNPFALKPIPPPPPPPAPPEPTNNTPPPSEVKISGITTLLGEARVFLEFIDPQTKKITRPPALQAGDKEGNVEVLSIDTEHGVVRIRQGETETSLDFEKNGVKPSAVASAAPAHNPGMPHPVPPPVAGMPGAAATAPGAGAVANAGSLNSSRAIVAGGGPITATAPGINPAGMSAAAANPMMYGAGGMPARPIRADGGLGNVIVTGQGQSIGTGTTPKPTATATPTMSREEAEIAIEARRRALEAQGSSVSRILPPTRFSTPTPTPPRPGQ